MGRALIHNFPCTNSEYLPKQGNQQGGKQSGTFHKKMEIIQEKEDQGPFVRHLNNKANERCMKYDISNILENYTEINIGVLTGKGLGISQRNPELQQIKSEALLKAEDKVGCDPITRHPYIASWRDLYRSFGSKPGDYRPSAEALVRRSMKRGGLPTINTAVDAYNAVSVKHLIPMGGFDTGHVEGDIMLRLSEGGEKFTPLGSEQTKETYPGEAVYADQARILTRRWNYRDCDQTKITTETTNIVIFIDGTPQIPVQEIQNALDELETILQKTCRGTYHTTIANKENPVVELS